jgi:hypothetical protein
MTAKIVFKSETKSGLEEIYTKNKESEKVSGLCVSVSDIF